MHVAIIPDDVPDDSTVLMFKHPRTGELAPFIKTETKLYEILENDRQTSSWMIGNFIVSSGSAYILVEFNPVFLFLAELLTLTREYYEYDDFWTMAPSLKEYQPLAKISQNAMKKICEVRMIDVEMYRADQNRIYNYLVEKVENLVPLMKEESGLLEQHFLIEISLDVLKHYIPSSICSTLKEKLKEKYPEAFPAEIQQVIMTEPHNDQQKKAKPVKPPVRKPPASKEKPTGNKLLTAFFSSAKK